MPGKFRRIGIQVPPTESESDAHDVVRDVLQSGAERVGAKFTEPDDDWDPIWMIVTKTQGTLLMPGSDVDKYEMTDAVATLARRWGAIGLGHLHSSWIVTDPESVAIATERNGSTVGLPRDEVLLLATYTAGNARHYTASITRHEDGPPTLGPFELMFDATENEIVKLAGAMVDPLMKALERVG